MGRDQFSCGAHQRNGQLLSARILAVIQPVTVSQPQSVQQLDPGLGDFGAEVVLRNMIMKKDVDA